MNRRGLFIFLLGGMLAGTGSSQSLADGDKRRKRKGRDRDDEAEQVYRDRREGRLLPLATIMAQVRKAYPGRIAETEFYSGGRPYYEFYIIQKNGRLREVKADARTGEIFKVEYED